MSDYEKYKGQNIREREALRSRIIALIRNDLSLLMEFRDRKDSLNAVLVLLKKEKDELKKDGFVITADTDFNQQAVDHLLDLRSNPESLDKVLDSIESAQRLKIKPNDQIQELAYLWGWDKPQVPRHGVYLRHVTYADVPVYKVVPGKRGLFSSRPETKVQIGTKKEPRYSTVASVETFPFPVYQQTRYKGGGRFGENVHKGIPYNWFHRALGGKDGNKYYAECSTLRRATEVVTTDDPKVAADFLIRMAAEYRAVINRVK